MAETKKGRKARVCVNCAYRSEQPDLKACPVCRSNLLTICPGCMAVIEDNGDARECKACGIEFSE